MYSQSAPEIQQIFRFLPGYFLILTPDLRVVTATQATLQATGTTLEQIAGKTFAEAFPENPATTPQSLAKLRQTVAEVLASRQTVRWPVQRIDLPDPAQPGAVLETYWETTFTPVPDETGEISYLIREALDVTGSVLAERQFKAYKDLEQATAVSHLQQRLNRFLTQAPAGICIFSGPELVYEFVNPHYQRLFPGRELLHKPLLEALPELAGQEIMQRLTHVYQTGETVEGREMCIQIAGAEGEPLQDHYFNYVNQARLNEKGQPDGIMSFAYDVTELVRARQLVEETAHQLHLLNQDLEARVAARTAELQLARADAERERARMESFFMQAPAAICVYEGPEFRYVFLNETYQQLFPGRQLLGLPLFEALAELRETEIYAIINKVYATGEPYYGREQRVLLAETLGGPLHECYYNFIYQAKHNEQGAIDGVMCFAYEVTDQVQARLSMERSRQKLEDLTAQLQAANLRLQAAKQSVEATNLELAAANRQLRHTNSDLDTFVYTASHDLKSPIYNLEGLITELQEVLSPVAGDPAEITRMLGMMETSLGRFRKTIDQLTDISRLQKEPNLQELSEVSLPTVLKEVLLDLDSLIQSSGAELAICLEGCPLISFSEKNLRSVLYNLLSNALKYRSPERRLRVELSCRLVKGYLLLCITDNGLGMNTAQQLSLFSMFKRFHTHVEGTGVGLYMVKRMLENAGGRIGVESEAGQGTVFKVWFKAA